jgi:ClpP class serine protease
VKKFLSPELQELVLSIGVISSHIDQSSFDDKQGLKYTTIFAGKRKNDLNSHQTKTFESLENLRKEEGAIEKTALDWNPQGYRTTARPKRT